MERWPTADCYSTAGTDAAITAALLAYYTSSQVDALLGDYRTGTARAITAALLAYYTSSQVDALLGDYRTASAQDTQTQAAIAGALLAYRTGPDQDVFTNQITSALVAYRSAADQDTATASSIAHSGALARRLMHTCAGTTRDARKFRDLRRDPRECRELRDPGASEAPVIPGPQKPPPSAPGGPVPISAAGWTLRSLARLGPTDLQAASEKEEEHPNPCVGVAKEASQSCVCSGNLARGYSSTLTQQQLAVVARWV